MASVEPLRRRREAEPEPEPWVDGLPGRVHELAQELIERWTVLSDGSKLTALQAIERGTRIIEAYFEDPSDVGCVAGTVPELTARELEVLAAIARCGTTARAAAELCVSLSTVRTHVRNALFKLGMHSRTEAVAWALQRHLISVLEFH